MELRAAIPNRLSLATAACLLACAACMCAPCAHADKLAKSPKPPKESKRADTREIENMETQWHDAMLKGDAAALGKLLADDFSGISANGTISDKQQYMDRLARRRNQFTRIDVVEQKVRMRPTTAIVTSQARVVGQLDGQPIEGIYRYTKVYGREDGAWHVLNFEATRVSGHHKDDGDMHNGMPLNRNGVPLSQVTPTLH